MSTYRPLRSRSRTYDARNEDSSLKNSDTNSRSILIIRNKSYIFPCSSPSNFLTVIRFAMMQEKKSSSLKQFKTSNCNSMLHQGVPQQGKDVAAHLSKD